MFRHIALAALLGLAAAQAPAPQISIAEPAFTPLDIPLSQLAKTVTGNQPEQIKIAVAGSGGISLSWLTGNATIKPGCVQLPNITAVPSVVRYGTVAANLTRNVTGSQTAYTQLYTPYFGFEQNYSSPVIHFAKLTGLTANQTYFYTVGDGSTANTSPVLNFTTPPARGAYPVRLYAMADLGQTPNSSTTVQHMLTSASAYSSSAPAIVYASVLLTMLPAIMQTYQPKEDSWGRSCMHRAGTALTANMSAFRLVQSLTQRFAFMTTAGNHEVGSGVHALSYIHRWYTPFKESASSSPFFYSFNYGGAHVISLSNYVWPNYQYSSAQYQWLQADLQSVNRTQTPWVVVQFHNPWYSTYAGSFKQVECLRYALEPLLYKYGVDLILNGHVHAYERSYRANDWKIDPCGTISITIGDGGNTEGLSSQFVDTPGQCTTPAATYYFRDLCNTPPAGFGGALFAGGNHSGFCPLSGQQAAISAFREPSYGFGTLDIINATTAQWQWHRNADTQMVVADSVYITRNTTCPNQAPTISNAVAAQPVLNTTVGYTGFASFYQGFAPSYLNNSDAN
eukprot:jgi/Astpho2/3873/Aster-04384